VLSVIVPASKPKSRFFATSDDARCDHIPDPILGLPVSGDGSFPRVGLPAQFTAISWVAPSWVPEQLPRLVQRASMPAEVLRWSPRVPSASVEQTATYFARSGQRWHQGSAFGQAAHGFTWKVRLAVPLQQDFAPALEPEHRWQPSVPLRQSPWTELRAPCCRRLRPMPSD
jgi:hypothetical protein